MEKIIIGFSKGKGFVPISWAIKLFEGTPYSHAYVKLPSASLERTLVYEATGKGIFFKSMEYFNSKSQPVYEYEVEITPEQKKRVLQFCIDSSGKSYGQFQILSIFIKRTAQRFGINLNNLFPNSNKNFICSELAAKILEILGYQFDEELDLISPKELQEHMISIGKLIS